MVGCIENCIKNIGIMQEGVGINSFFVRWEWAEKGIIQWNYTILLNVIIVWVNIEHEIGVCGMQEFEHGDHDGVP